MTGKSNKDFGALTHLTDALVEDILETSDEDILAEFQDAGGDASRYAAEMSDQFEKCIIAANKTKLSAAKAGVAAARSSARPIARSVDAAGSRAKLKTAMNMSSLDQKLTLAARKESELSDADVIGMLEDLEELGILPPEANGNGGV